MVKRSLPRAVKSVRRRLAAYGLFSENTINAVVAAARKQATYGTYQELFTQYAIPRPTLYVTTRGSGVPVVDVPAQSGAPKATIVLHLPMGNPLDTNQLYQVATIAAVNSSYRVIAFGNPSGGKYNFREQSLTVWQKVKIAFTSDPSPLVEAELAYLKSQAAQDVYHIGYSYGALKALIAAHYTNTDALKGVVCIDPVAHTRGLAQLYHDFRATFRPMGDYVNRLELPTYFKARQDASGAEINEGLRRPINIAIGLLLARIDFISYLSKVLARQKGISATVAWGTKSELGNDAHMKANIHNLAHATSGKVRALRLEGDTHALANDIYLHAAIIREALSK